MVYNVSAMKRLVKIMRPGLSLIELMFATAILSSSLLILIGIFPSIFSEIKQGKNILLATQVAQMKMEQALSSGFDTVAGSSGEVPKDTLSNGVISRASFSYSVVVSVLNTRVKKITVTVYETGSPLRYTKLETKIYKEP
jgi:type II secretory pathway pseudopilin PulG